MGSYTKVLVVSLQQNGIVERKNSHLLEVARSIIFTTNVLKTVWGDAVLTVYYLINRMPSRVLEFQTHLKKINVVSHIRDGNGADHFGYPPRPSPPLMGRDIIFLNGYGTGLGFFLKPGVGSGIAPPCPAPP